MDLKSILGMIEGLAPLAKQVQDLGLSAAGVSMANMTRISNLETVVMHIVEALQRDTGLILPATVTPIPTPSAMVKAAPPSATKSKALGLMDDHEDVGVETDVKKPGPIVLDPENVNVHK